MALFNSQVIAGASGSVGGVTFSRNRFGRYMRARVTPVDPGSDEQVAVRAFMSMCVTRWTETLTQAQRDGWSTYGANVPILNALGEEVFLTGQQWYVGNNITRLQAGLAFIDDGPTVFDRGSFSLPPVTISEATQLASVAFDNTEFPYNEDDAGLLVWISRPIAASRQFFKGPYRFVGVIAGDAGTPPTSPETFTLPFFVAAGNKVGVRFRAVAGDGRATGPFRVVEIAGA